MRKAEALEGMAISFYRIEQISLEIFGRL